MEATAWFCQPSPPLHPACLLLCFSLSGDEMSQGLGPNLPWVLWRAPCSSLEVTLEASSVPSKLGVSCKGDRSGNLTLETPAQADVELRCHPSRANPLKCPGPVTSWHCCWERDAPLAEPAGLHQRRGAGARAGGDARGEPWLQTLPNFLRFLGWSPSARP